MPDESKNQIYRPYRHKSLGGPENTYSHIYMQSLRTGSLTEGLVVYGGGEDTHTPLTLMYIYSNVQCWGCR